MIIDAHVHVACPDTARYPRRPSGLGSEWWKTGGGPDELTRTLEENGVARAVVVHAGGLYGTDCRCAADVVAADPTRFALVTGLDMGAPDPPADLLAAANAGATGVRLSAVGAEDSAWLRDGRAAAVWAAAAEARVVVVANLRPDQLADLADLGARVPGAQVALDHCGFIRYGATVGDDAALVRLAEVPGVHLKVTSLNLGGSGSSDWLGGLVGAFGPDRLCWGSDHPQTQDLSYSDMRRVAEDAATELSEGEREDFFAGTSLRLWWR
jgi:predicted TIM-barrel fold metal-dependent hydrolase